MKTNSPRPLHWLVVLILGLSASVASAQVTGVKRSDANQISYKNELQHSIERGLTWLQTNQNPSGWWSTADYPAVTGLALMAFEADPRQRYHKAKPAWMDRGYQYLLGCVQPDGGIHKTNLPTYNTAICMLSLQLADRPAYNPAILKARRFLIGLQSDFGDKGKLDSPFDGGIGYGSKYGHSDMGNTLQALEALYYSKSLVADKNLTETSELDLAAAIHFLSRCQNLPSHNPESWASDDAQNKGGFIYYPGHSMAGSVTNAATGKVALRSYGSISYGGLLSFIYADLKRDDPRVKAVFEWLGRNYTLAENPGLGKQGLYYYYHTMAKALTAFGIDELPLADGRKVAWRKELSQRLLELQEKDGSWCNDNVRWWEKDSALVTSYAVHTLGIIYHGL